MTDATRPIRVVLASQSPRRRELLTLIGIAHEVMPADIDESYLAGELPHAHAERLAREKAATIAARVPDALTIAADTIVVVDGDPSTGAGQAVLGKPKNEADAMRMLSRLSGRTHTVITAVAADWRGTVLSDVEEVEVTFRALDDDEIRAYVATREPMDKAGAYGIQGYGATIVTRIEGDYFAVMGLPVNRLVRLVDRLGVHYEFGPLMARESDVGRRRT